MIDSELKVIGTGNDSMMDYAGQHYISIEFYQGWHVVEIKISDEYPEYGLFLEKVSAEDEVFLSPDVAWTQAKIAAHKRGLPILARHSCIGCEWLLKEPTIKTLFCDECSH